VFTDLDNAGENQIPSLTIVRLQRDFALWENEGAIKKQGEIWKSVY
jgi:hypothetical protein